jgi:hypothetical protein
MQPFIGDRATRETGDKELITSETQLAGKWRKKNQRNTMRSKQAKTSSEPNDEQCLKIRGQQKKMEVADSIDFLKKWKNR